MQFPGFWSELAYSLIFSGNGLKSVTATLTQVVVPGRVVLNVMSHASYPIFLGRPSMVNGKIWL